MTAPIGNVCVSTFTSDSVRSRPIFVFWGASPADALQLEIVQIAGDSVEVYVTEDEWAALSEMREASAIRASLQSLRDPEVLSIRTELFAAQQQRFSDPELAHDSDQEISLDDAAIGPSRSEILDPERSAIRQEASRRTVTSTLCATQATPSGPAAPTTLPESSPPHSRSLFERIRETVLALFSRVQRAMSEWVQILLRAVVGA